jgi:hypothetical protein
MWKNMCSQEVEVGLFIQTFQILGDFILLVSNPNGDL